MTVTDALKNAYKNVFRISGRACRKEFWMYRVSVILILLILALLNSYNGEGIQQNFANNNSRIALKEIIVIGLMLYLSVGMLTVTIRRLHDLGRSGWTLAISWIPFYHLYITLNVCFVRGTIGLNKFGNDPCDEKDETIVGENYQKMAADNTKSYKIAIALLSIVLAIVSYIAISNYNEIQRVNNEYNDSLSELTSMIESQTTIINVLNDKLSNAEAEVDLYKEKCTEYEPGYNNYKKLVSHLKTYNCGWASNKFYTKKPIVLIDYGDTEIPIVCKYNDYIHFYKDGSSATAEWSTKWNNNETKLVVRPTGVSGLTSFKITTDANNDSYEIFAIRE